MIKSVMYYFDYIKQKKILKSDYIKNAQAFFTTRELSLCDKSDPYNSAISVNLKLLADYLNIKPHNLISPIQTHSQNIRVVKENCFEYPDTDALILINTSQAVFLSYADCTPIILYDEKQNIGAVIHAGWKGTSTKITQKTARILMDDYNSSADNLVALIGPAICKNCYKVGEDVYIKLKSTVDDCSGIEKLWEQTQCVDLQKINEKQLTELGIFKIDISSYCTSCNNDFFYSYRKENSTSLRHNAVLMLSNVKLRNI